MDFPLLHCVLHFDLFVCTRGFCGTVYTILPFWITIFDISYVFSVCLRAFLALVRTTYELHVSGIRRNAGTFVEKDVLYTGGVGIRGRELLWWWCVRGVDARP